MTPQRPSSTATGKLCLTRPLGSGRCAWQAGSATRGRLERGSAMAGAAMGQRGRSAAPPHIAAGTWGAPCRAARPPPPFPAGGGGSGRRHFVRARGRAPTPRPGARPVSPGASSRRSPWLAPLGALLAGWRPGGARGSARLQVDSAAGQLQRPASGCVSLV